MAEYPPLLPLKDQPPQLPHGPPAPRQSAGPDQAHGRVSVGESSGEPDAAQPVKGRVEGSVITGSHESAPPR